MTAPPFSLAMKAVAESGVKTIERGRAGVLIRPTIFSEAVSMATTSLSPSQLT